MKYLLLFALAIAPLGAAESLYVTPQAGKALPALRVGGSGTTTITGQLVYGGIGNAPEASWSGKVILLERGTITYLQKLDAVKAAGGIAVIIANNVAGINTATATSTLPAVTVSQADGAALKALAGTAVRVGTVAPPYVPPVGPVLPDPKGQAGMVLGSDGEKYVWVKAGAGLPIVPVIATGESVAVGESVTFSVSADGSPTPTWQWKRDGIDLPGATNVQFQIVSATANDAGMYSCVATNEVGTAKSNEIGLAVK